MVHGISKSTRLCLMKILNLPKEIEKLTTRDSRALREKNLEEKARRSFQFSKDNSFFTFTVIIKNA